MGTIWKLSPPRREDGPTFVRAELLLPLFSEAFWDDGGHVLNIAGDQGDTNALRTWLI